MANYATLVALGENCIQTIQPGEAFDFSKAEGGQNVVNGIIYNQGKIIKINKSGVYHIDGFVITDRKLATQLVDYKIDVMRNGSENVASGQGNMLGDQVSFVGIAKLNSGDELKVVNKTEPYPINIDGVRFTVYKID